MFVSYSLTRRRSDSDRGVTCLAIGYTYRHPLNEFPLIQIKGSDCKYAQHVLRPIDRRDKKLGAMMRAGRNCAAFLI
jgi:hypothetical protein